MHWAFWVIWSVVAAVSPRGPAPSEIDLQTADDEQALRAAGLTVDGPALLEFFRQRSRLAVDAAELQALTRQLGDPAAEVRTRAAGALVARGAAALPALRHAANSLTNPVAAEHARQCLQRLEGGEAVNLPLAAARLLGLRKPPGAALALLAYLPFADDASVAEQVGTTLAALAFAGGQPDPVLLRALEDPLPLRRAAATEALCRTDHPDLWPALRKLLHDPSAAVRLRVGLVLTKQLDAASVPVLIDLLAELPAADRQRAQEALQELAGDWAPAVGQLKDDAIARKIARDSWAAWWKNTDGPALLAEFRKRTLTPADRKKVADLIEQLGARAFAAREKASARLVALGPLAAPLLREAARGKQSERARRAAACLERIARGKQDPLPAAAPRLVALRRPPGAAEVLLDYLPGAEDETLIEGVQQTLGVLARAGGKPSPALLAALDDPLPRRRQAAGEALGRHGGPESWPSVHKLLRDPDPGLRLRVAVALAAGGDRAAVPELIRVLGELPSEQAGPAEEALRLLAGGRGPEAPAGDGPALRHKYRDAWAAWWKERGDKVELDRLNGVSPQLGYTLLVEVGGNGNGRVREVTRDGKVRWAVEGLNFPVDAWVLGGNRILVAEYNGNRVTERDLKGNILWQKTGLRGLPVNVQRLSNGNTFIATSADLTEVDPKGKVLSQHTPPNGVTAACRLRNGETVVLTNDGMCCRLDAKGKELKRFNSGRNAGWTSGLDVSPDGKILVAQPNRGQVAEFDRDGKLLWQTAAANITTASRLPSGRVLVASHTGRSATELDRAGRTVWQFRSDLPVFRARRR
jgi:HEAT repeat protein